MVLRGYRLRGTDLACMIQEIKKISMSVNKIRARTYAKLLGNEIAFLYSSSLYLIGFIFLEFCFFSVEAIFSDSEFSIFEEEHETKKHANRSIKTLIIFFILNSQS